MPASVLFTALLIGAPALKERAPSEADIVNGVVGSWGHGPGDGSDWAWAEEFQAGGTWRAEARQVTDGAVAFTAEGRWSTRRDRVVITVETCKFDEFAGRRYEYMVVELTRTELRRKSKNGEVTRLTRSQ